MPGSGDPFYLLNLVPKRGQAPPGRRAPGADSGAGTRAAPGGDQLAPAYRSASGERSGMRTRSGKDRPEFPHLKVLYASVVVLFLIEVSLSFSLYAYVSRVEEECLAGRIVHRSAEEKPPDDESPVKGESVLLAEKKAPTAREGRRTRRSAVEDSNAVPSNDEDYNVEFFHPKMKSELEEKDRARPKEETVNNPWVWLTSYSRIPVCVLWKPFISNSNKLSPEYPVVRKFWRKKWCSKLA
ncbi:uncharacterized protein LOC124164966 [Ischnura elegans]|uniref:uncharacterized protein LOC124164966 n=1 Tax=Ischnura elegans TaxID=197161 RepID=UPI001ED87920|nr:uncharacterized protein LOC124164966 [Ischnura elegans]